MFRRLLVLLIALTIISPLFAEGNQEDNGEGQKVYKMRFSHGLPPTHSWAKTLDQFARLVEEKSDGQIEVEVYTSGQLYKPNELYEAVRAGLVESGSLFTVYLQPNAPMIDALSPVGTVWNREIEEEIIKGFLKEEGPGWEIVKAIEAVGIKPLAWFSTGCAGNLAGYAGTGKPVNTPEEMQGKKVRGLGALNAKAIESWGGRPVYMSGSDLYTGLQRGTIDMSYVTPSHLINRKLSEATDWYAAGVPGSALQQFYPVVSVDFFNSLPAHLQDALIEAGREMTQKRLDLDYEFNPYIENEKLLQELKEMDDFKVIEQNIEQQTLWAKSCEPIHEERMKELGPEAIKVYNMVSEMEKKFGLPYYFIK